MIDYKLRCIPMAYLLLAVTLCLFIKNDGSIETGEIYGWSFLPYADKQKVWNEQKKLGIRYNPNSKNKKYIRKDDSKKNNAATANHLK